MTTTTRDARDGLVAAGLSEAEAAGKARLLQATRAALGAGTGPGIREYFVPGRIEVLGKHTDYAGGRSLLCAMERGFVVSARGRDDDRLVVTDVVSGATGEFSVSPEQPARTHWHNYPAAVARRLARNFGGPLRGADIAFGSDLPRASGLSSSTAFVIAVFCAIADGNRLDARPEYTANIRTIEDLAGYLGAVENGRSYGTLAGDTGVGTLGGSQDHTAILCSRPGHLVVYAFGPVARESAVALPRDHTFVIASSGIAASKTGAARAQYNRAAATAAALLDRWRDATGESVGTLGELHRRDRTAFERLPALIGRQGHGGFSQAELLGRFDQFVREALVLVPDAARALAAGDLARFGTLVDESQAGAEHGLHNQVPETLTLAHSARTLGAVAASAFGAGFGGSVWALVPASAPEFTEAWRGAYARHHPEPAQRAVFFPTGAGPALVRL